MSFPVNSIIRAQRGNLRITAIVGLNGLRALRLNDTTWSMNGERQDMPFWATVDDLLTAFPADLTWSVKFAYPRNFFDNARDDHFNGGRPWAETYAKAHAKFRAICKRAAEPYNLTTSGGFFDYTYTNANANRVEAVPEPVPVDAAEPVAYDYKIASDLALRLQVAQSNQNMAQREVDDATKALTDYIQSFATAESVAY